MADFPTLSINPDAENWEEGPAIDPTLSSEFESGHLITRPRTTVTPWSWSFTYRFMSNADKVTLKNFEKNTAKYRAVEFNWTNPIDGLTYVVKFAENLKYYLENNGLNEWRVAVKLVEARPSSS